VVAEDAMSTAWNLVGTRPGRWEFLLTTAALVGAVNAVLSGLGIALVATTVGAGGALTVLVGVLVAVVAFGVQFAYIVRASAAPMR
jgi:hypothetical protein